jgi:hypothetical protein
VKYVIPEEVLKGHTAVVGMTGSGKTSTEKLLVEQVVADNPNARVCVLDTLKSDWWGITSSASGKSAGLPFKILGGPRGHVPLHSSAGKVIGQLVGTGKLPLSIVDMADFEAGGIQRFFVDFAQSLWRHARGVVYVVIEEAHEIAPKERAGFNAENMAIHWAKKLATGSRTKGIRLIVATQRTQALHNAMLGSCQTVIAHQLMFDADQTPVINWVKSVNKAVAPEVANSIASLPVGTGWICSGRAKIFEKVHFPKFKTYDNTATPEGGDDEIDIKTAPVNQDELRSLIGEEIAKAEADDPKKLRARIAALEVAAKKAPAVTALDLPKKEQLEQIKAAAIKEAKKAYAPLRSALEAAMKFIIEINARDFFKDGGEAVDQKAIEKAISDATAHVGKLIEGRLAARDKELASVKSDAQNLVVRLKTLIDKADDDVKISVDVTHNKPFTVSSGSHPPVQPTRHQPSPAASGDGTLTNPQRQLLKALAWWSRMGHDNPSRPQVAAIAGWKVTAGHLRNVVGSLNASGHTVSKDGHIALTDLGAAAAPEPDMGVTLVDGLRGVLTNPQKQIFEVLLESGSAMTRADLATSVGWDANAGHLRNVIGSMRTLEIIDYPSSGMVELQAWVLG